MPLQCIRASGTEARICSRGFQQASNLRKLLTFHVAHAYVTQIVMWLSLPECCAAFTSGSSQTLIGRARAAALYPNAITPRPVRQATARSRVALVRPAAAPYIISLALADTPTFSLSKCSGFTLTSEDSSEVAFLLVENYNYDCSSWSSDRLGIFEPFSVRCAFR
jgi:hypothetical protein